MIREERDPAWWSALLTHPDVAPGALLGGDASFLDTMLSDPLVLPWATQHGGFLFVQRDGIGTVFEGHISFRPEGWGRHAAQASLCALVKLFSLGAQIVVGWEFTGRVSSRPPLSHGWRPAGPFQHSDQLAAEVRAWVLTRNAWNASPARRRMCQALSEACSEPAHP